MNATALFLVFASYPHLTASLHDPGRKAQRGLVSDAYVHFTPEYYSSLDWEVRSTSSTGGEIRLNYFHRDRREIERQFIALCAFHGRILKVFDRCFDGLLSGDESVRKQMAAIWIVGKAFGDDYQTRYQQKTGVEDSEVL
jgi:hypothetical protein